MLFFTNHARHALPTKICKRFCRVLQQPRPFCRFSWRHRGRQIDQPLGICRKPAHHFQRGQRVFLPHGHVVMQPRRDNSLSDHVINVEQIVLHLLRSERGHGFRRRGDNWFHGLRVHRTRCDGNHLLLRIPQGRQTPTEDAARIDVDRPIQPIGLRHGSVAIYHHRSAAVLSRPVVTHGQSEFVGLAGRLAIQREIAHLSRTAPLHLLFHPRVCNHELSLVQ